MYFFDLKANTPAAIAMTRTTDNTMRAFFIIRFFVYSKLVDILRKNGIKVFSKRTNRE